MDEEAGKKTIESVLNSSVLRVVTKRCKWEVGCVRGRRAKLPRSNDNQQLLFELKSQQQANSLLLQCTRAISIFHVAFLLLFLANLPQQQPMNECGGATVVDQCSP